MTETDRPAAVAGGGWWWLPWALVALAAACLLSLCVGARTVPPAEVWAALTGSGTPGTDDWVVVRDLRVPRTLLGVAVGAALAVSGALAQLLTRNPLAEPGLLGVTSGASFAIVLGTVLGVTGSQAATLAAALLGAVLATGLVVAVGGASPLRLVLAGVALSAVLSGAALALRLTDPEAYDDFRFWTVGTLAGREQVGVQLPLVGLGLALLAALLLVRRLSVLALGEEVAHTLGTSVAATRVLTVVVLTVLAAGATALAGPIGFVGLIVPHLVRRFAHGSVATLLAGSLLGGPVLVVVSDVAARVLLPTGELPVALVTAFLGGPFLIAVVGRLGGGER